ncbi:MAG TPA: Gfo/Idh/MocA family oxidoreductase [Terriglobia bacterium]|nr:Gfo/Idh/MocA family oxidoreductase [Terriglobia bacterium]
MRNKTTTPPLADGRGSLNRRQFFAGVGGAAMSYNMMRAGLARGSQANSKISLGLIGCGGRGTWIADLFRKHGGFEITAAHDYFADRVAAFGDKYSVPAVRRFTGLKGFQRLLEAKVDAVAIESPPYFHHEQAAAAVEAGVHVYLAKPVAVDVPGCRSIEWSAKKAEEKKLAFLIDFQTRTDPFYQEAIRRVQKEASIGRIISGEVSYVAGSPWTRFLPDLGANPQDPERRLRAWGVSRALSGDIITEQNIHSLDVMTWVLDQHPVKALGTGGLKSRTLGDVRDHFSVTYWFREDVLVTFYSKQYGEGADDIRCQMFGTEGTIDTHYAGDVSIKGKSNYSGGRDGNLFTTGAERNIATFYDQVTSGRLDYTTVAPSVRSNLTTILGRTAAYKQAEFTWEDLMRSEEKLDPHLEGLKE